jgi:hypothetical protein
MSDLRKLLAEATLRIEELEARVDDLGDDLLDSQGDVASISIMNDELKAKLARVDGCARYNMVGTVVGPTMEWDDEGEYVQWHELEAALKEKG